MGRSLTSTGPVSETLAPVIACSRASMSARCADQSTSIGATSATDITATSATAMMVRTLRTGKRLPLRLDELPCEQLGDHRGAKWRESMTVTTNRPWSVRAAAQRPSSSTGRRSTAALASKGGGRPGHPSDRRRDIALRIAPDRSRMIRVFCFSEIVNLRPRRPDLDTGRPGEAGFICGNRHRSSRRQ